MILAVQDDNPKLVNVVAFADVDIEESVESTLSTNTIGW